MKKIVTITQYVNRPESAASSRVQCDATAVCGAAAGACQERTRGILLQFPKAYEGPLTAAVVTLAAVLGALVSNVRI